MADDTTERTAVVHVRVVGVSFSGTDGVYEHGETLTVAEHTLAAHPNTLARAADDDDGDTEATDEPIAEPPTDPAVYSIDELEQHLAAHTYDAAELNALADAEQAGKNRTGAAEAIADARSE